jgi:hypothetical protein
LKQTFEVSVTYEELIVERRPASKGHIPHAIYTSIPI